MIENALYSTGHDFVNGRLGQLKEELKESQGNREQVESIQSQVMEKRKGALSLQFQEWTLDVSGRIPLALVSGHTVYMDTYVSMSHDILDGNMLLFTFKCNIEYGIYCIHY